MDVCLNNLFQPTMETTCQSEYEVMAETNRNGSLFVCFKVLGIFCCKNCPIFLHTKDISLATKTLLLSFNISVCLQCESLQKTLRNLIWF